MKKSLSLKFFTSLLVLVINQAHAESYSLTITNLTSGQLFSSPVCAIHNNTFDLFSLGSKATNGIGQLAEDGVTGTLLNEVKKKTGITSTLVGGLISARGTSQLSFTASKNQLLSCAAMLGSTNDGFFAIRKAQLPTTLGKTTTVLARSYDAGSERNSETCETVPGPPCGNHFARDTKGAEGSIQFHKGIKGVGDLNPTIYGWKDPVARIRIKRVK